MQAFRKLKKQNQDEHQKLFVVGTAHSKYTLSEAVTYVWTQTTTAFFGKPSLKVTVFVLNNHK